MSEAINPYERDECWLCDMSGEVEVEVDGGITHVVGCPVCVQNDHEWYRQKAESERDALAANVEHLDDLRRRVIEAVNDDSLDILDVSDYRDCVQPKIETNLAQLKARVAVEAWVDAADEVMKLTYPKAAKTFRLTASRHLKYKAEKLRQEADEIAAGGGHEDT